MENELKENLVVLLYAFNNCYTLICDVDDLEKELISQQMRSDKGKPVTPLEIDYEKNEWTWGRYGSKIGNGIRGMSFGVIGVYDRRNIKHLSTMMYDSRNATQDPGCCFDD
ncbi:MAG: hypothetical protein JW791_00100 [Nanoarchaeota archaeon]|nr:hypothetical protein [Nanoarchaeota archaeon]